MKTSCKRYNSITSLCAKYSLECKTEDVQSRYVKCAVGAYTKGILRYKRNKPLKAVWSDSWDCEAATFIKNILNVEVENVERKKPKHKSRFNFKPVILRYIGQCNVKAMTHDATNLMRFVS